MRGRAYDVVIAGASFAGLAVAQRLASVQSPKPLDSPLRGSLVVSDPSPESSALSEPDASRRAARSPSVLLLDKAPIGDGVTSACGAPLAIVRAMGAEASVQQVHHEIAIHTARSKTIWPLPQPFCTFDYRRCCELAFTHTGTEFRQVSVLGRTGNVVHTTAGDVSARFLVDATGWRAALISSGDASLASHRWMAFGVETEVAAEVGPGLHFHFVPEIRDGYAWVFPAGDKVRIGVLSYRGRSKLRLALQTFLDRLDVRPEGYHGGFLASGMRPPVIDGVFITGDAAGQCLPVTGEGIRTAILAGFRCGELLQDMLEGAISEHDAHQAYAEFVDRSRRRYRALLGMNAALLALPIPVRGVVASIVGHPRLLRMFMRHYLGIFRMAVPLAPRAFATAES